MSIRKAARDRADVTTVTRRMLRARRTFTRRAVRLVATILATAIVATGAVVGVQSASAASQGPGFGTWPSSQIGWEGAFVAPDGSLIYCIVPGAANPTGATSSAGIHSSIISDSPFGTATISGDAAAKINTIVTQYGQSWDNVNASAVSFVVKHLANPGATYSSSGWNGTHDLNGYINYKLVGLVGSATVGAIQARAQQLLAAVANVTAGAVNGSGTLVFTTDAANNYAGTVTMVGTSATGTVSLTNGTFVSTGSGSLAGMRQGVAYPVRGVPPTHDGAAYRISGSGTFGSGYAPALHLWTTPGQQAAVGPGGAGTFRVTGSDTVGRTVTFAPHITTQVEQVYAPGGTFVDHVTFGTSLNEWPRLAGGAFATITATARVYKTPTQPTSPTTEIPEDAVDVGGLTVVTDPAIGPSQSYRVESEWELPGPGHYTAVWSIVGADQSAQTIAYLQHGPTYERHELFGEKTQMTMVPNITSQAQPTAQKGGTALDTVIVADVLPTGGAEISTALYRVPEDVEAFGACEAANLVWQSETLHIDAVGRYTFTAPVVPAFGDYAWQHRADDVEGREIMVSECGIESEMTSAPVPTIGSLAPETIGYAGLVHDVAIVDGLVPADGETYVTFELYRAVDGVAPIESCTADSLVGDTSNRPIVITQAGEYTSPGIRVTEAGTHYSVEYLWWRADAEDDPIVLDEGECGLAHETTVVSEPSLRTQATPSVGIGDTYRDEAFVEGLGDDVAAEIVFEVFHNAHNQAPTCTAETLVDTGRTSIVGSGVFASPALTASKEGRQLWVATLQHTPEGADGPVVLAKGACGEEDEVTLVRGELPLTGSLGTPWVAGLAGLALLAGATILLIRVRRSTAA
ncbi:hypothetical protein [Microbacterium sp. NPDC055357]